jgi:hypothetical protein
VLRPKSNYKQLGEAYYIRGALKYKLNKKDTTAAEADRTEAQKYNKVSDSLISFHEYWDAWHKNNEVSY